jgi:hypothetical protein
VRVVRPLFPSCSKGGYRGVWILCRSRQGAEFRHTRGFMTIADLPTFFPLLASEIASFVSTVLTLELKKNSNLAKSLRVGGGFVISRSSVQIRAPAPRISVGALGRISKRIIQYLLTIFSPLIAELHQCNSNNLTLTK